MGKRVYLKENGIKGEYLFHNHGIVETFIAMGIGKVDFQYMEFLPEDLANHGISKQQLAKDLVEGHFVVSKVDDKDILYRYATPVSASISLNKRDIRLMETLQESGQGEICENIAKMLEQHEMRQKESYDLYVEISSPR